MRRKSLLAALGLVFLLSCGTKRMNMLDPQLEANFQNHVSEFDPSLVLDSFRLVRVDTIFEKQGRMIDLFFYHRELARVDRQLADAEKMHLADSAAFYAYESKYMNGQIDSLSKLVSHADTSRPLVLIAHCFFELGRKDLRAKDTTFYVMDNNLKVINGDMVDSLISRTSRKLKKMSNPG
jgi:hypothetical protein